MFDKLNIIKERYYEIQKILSDPEVVSDQQRYKKLLIELNELESVVHKYNEYEEARQHLHEATELAKEETDKDFLEEIDNEIRNINHKMERITKELKVLLLPKDPNDEKSVIIEIRGGAGGEEANLFVAVLARMYMRYAEKKRWKTEVLDSNPTEIGGFKEIIFSVSGIGVYSKLKFESGVHRVQRIPTTEANGRIHTSTVTVAVLPEIEEVDISINQEDLRIDTYRASGAGGQHINKTDSAIRITHIPTGIVVSCQDQRSQLKNKDKALRILRAKINEIEEQKRVSAVAETRRIQVGTGDRSERIRTYNYPQGRMTDHRISLTLYRLEDIFEGDIEELIEGLVTADQAQKLSTFS